MFSCKNTSIYQIRNFDLHIWSWTKMFLTQSFFDLITIGPNKSFFEIKYYLTLEHIFFYPFIYANMFQCPFNIELIFDSMLFGSEDITLYYTMAILYISIVNFMRVKRTVHFKSFDQTQVKPSLQSSLKIILKFPFASHSADGSEYIIFYSVVWSINQSLSIKSVLGQVRGTILFVCLFDANCLQDVSLFYVKERVLCKMIYHQKLP